MLGLNVRRTQYFVYRVYILGLPHRVVSIKSSTPTQSYNKEELKARVSKAEVGKLNKLVTRWNRRQMAISMMPVP